MDALLKPTGKRKVFAFILLFSIACAPVQGRIGEWLLPRLLGTLALYVLHLKTLASRKGLRIGRKRVTLAALASTVLAISNLRPLKNGTDDFRRLSNPSTGYGASNPVALGGQVAFTEMFREKYAAMALQNNPRAL